MNLFANHAARRQHEPTVTMATALLHIMWCNNQRQDFLTWPCQSFPASQIALAGNWRHVTRIVE
eukprot:1105093-Amphidinium_carterae.2